MQHSDPFRNNPLVRPEPQAPGRARLAWAVSILFHVLFVIGLVVLPGRFTDDEPQPATIDIVFYKPEVVRPEIERVEVVEPEPEPEPEILPAPEPLPEPEPIEVAEVKPVPPPPPVPEPVAVAREIKPPPPAPKPLALPKPPPPPVETREVAVALPRPEPAQPRLPKRALPKTGAFTEAAPEAQPEKRPARVVAAVGSFGADTPEPRDAPAPSPGRVVAVASFGGGAVELPRELDLPRRTVVTGNGFAAEPEKEAPARPRRSVSSAAFGDDSGSAAQPARNDRSVNQGGFGAVENTTASSGPRSLPGEALDSPVEIVSKPTPAYTDEARSLRIEGEVVLEVTFVDTGELRVLRVLDGLGHGLDEAAVEAAKKIQFTPARRDGRPVDHTATLRVVFRLA